MKAVLFWSPPTVPLWISRGYREQCTTAHLRHLVRAQRKARRPNTPRLSPQDWRGPSLDCDLHCGGRDPGGGHLNGRGSGGRPWRHAEIHLVSVDRARVSDCTEHLSRLAVDGNVDGRTHHRRWTRRKRTARVDARPWAHQAGRTPTGSRRLSPVSPR